MVLLSRVFWRDTSNKRVLTIKIDYEIARKRKPDGLPLFSYGDVGGQPWRACILMESNH